jgi:hypothetical protein
MRSLHVRILFISTATSSKELPCDLCAEIA